MKKNPWIAAVLNFFFMGLGTLHIGRRKLTGAGLTLAAIALTYVELQLQAAAPALYSIMAIPRREFQIGNSGSIISMKESKKKTHFQLLLISPTISPRL